MTDDDLLRLYDLGNRAALRKGATYAEAHLAGLRLVAQAVTDAIHATRGAPA